MKQKEIILIRLSSLGDVAMLVPVLLSFHRAYPTVPIQVLSQRQFKPIFNLLHFVRFQAVSDKHNKPSLLELIRFSIQLSKIDKKVILDLHDVIRTKIIRGVCSLFGSKIFIIDKGRKEKKQLISLKGQHIYPLKSTFERYADVFHQAGFPFDLDKNLNLKKDKSSQEDYIYHIGIAPFAKHSSKEYSLSLLKEVLIEFKHYSNIKFYIFGNGESEKQKAENLIKGFKNTENTIGQSSFQEELHQISQLDLMLSMDSGNGHLAAMFGIPVVTVWGTTHPYLGFAPYGQPIEYSIFPNRNLYPELPTSIFGVNNNARYERAIDSISPKQIVEKIVEILSLTPSI